MALAKVQTGAVQAFYSALVSREGHDVIAVEQNVHRFVHVAALDDDGAARPFQRFFGPRPPCRRCPLCLAL